MLNPLYFHSFFVSCGVFKESGDTMMIMLAKVVVVAVTMMVVDQNAGGTVRNTSAPVMTVCTWAGAAFVR